MSILVLLDDLLFRSKLDAAAASTGAAIRVMSRVPQPADDWPLVLVDLNASTFDPIAAVAEIRAATPHAAIIGFCSHVQTDLMASARQAGCTEVLPRSAFVQRLPELLAAATTQR